MRFDELNLADEVLEGLSSMNFKEATPVQALAMPIIMNGKDLIACAQTGTGKTAAFLLPIISKLVQRPDRTGINTLIIVPTRELAMQIDQWLEGFSYFANISSMAIYGGGDGNSFTQQKTALTSDTDVIVATPGKLISHLSLGYVKFDKIEHLVLDEADRMLDMGFFEDIMRIVADIPKTRQTLMFSATMPPKIRTLAGKILQNQEEVSLSIAKPSDKVTQVAFMLYDNQKLAMVEHLLRFEDMQSVIVFASTKRAVKEIYIKFMSKKMSCGAIHSELTQDEREHALNQFRARKTRVLVATDVISRGIDIDGIDMVINYDVPNDAEDYVHRIGRTARAEAYGEAVTFVNDSSKEQKKFYDIESLIGYEVRKAPVPETFGKSPAYEPLKKGEFSRDKPYGQKSGGPRKPSSGGGGGTRKPQAGGGGRPPKPKDGGKR